MLRHSNATEPASRLWTEAFHSMNIYRYIYPDDSTRIPFLNWLFCRYLQVQRHVGRVFIDQQQARAKTLVVWHPPNPERITLPLMVRHGLLGLPLRWGTTPYKRLMELKQLTDEARRSTLGDDPTWYLNTIAIANRGQGLGSKLIEKHLEQFVDPSGLPASLVTQSERNVVFYRRHGFREMTEIDFAGGQERLWIMRRLPA